MKITIDIDDNTLCMSVTTVYTGKDDGMLLKNELYETRKIAELVAEQQTTDKK